MWLAPGHPSGWDRARTGTQAPDSRVRSFHHRFPPYLALSLVRTTPQSSNALARYLGSESFCISFLLSVRFFFSLSSFQGENLVSSSLKRERKKNPIWSVTHDTFPMSSHSSDSSSIDRSVPIRALWGHGDLDKCIWGPHYCGQDGFGNQNSQWPTKEASPWRTPSLSPHPLSQWPVHKRGTHQGWALPASQGWKGWHMPGRSWVYQVWVWVFESWCWHDSSSCSQIQKDEKAKLACSPQNMGSRGRGSGNPKPEFLTVPQKGVEWWGRKLWKEDWLLHQWGPCATGRTIRHSDGKAGRDS